MRHRGQSSGIGSDKFTDFLNAHNQPTVGADSHPAQDYRRVLGDPRGVVVVPLAQEEMGASARSSED